MNTSLNNLNFMVTLIDKVSAPIGKIMGSIDQAAKGFQSGFSRIAFGTAGLVGAAYSVDKLLEPTKEMQRALAEVRSLDVAHDTLTQLQKTALEFSSAYGESAADFVRSSYDIQSAIAGLKGNELPAFTRASAILAKGTKATTAEVTSFVGTMYNIFQKNADAMGKAEWVEQLAGQTAAAVKIFKTTGKGMSDAFTSIGAAGQVNGIAMSEQIAILGRLQATMSGAEAGTKYRTFLDNVGKAQETLNLKFTDAQGRMLPMVDILERIRDKFGAIDTVAESDLLKKAFGTQESVALIKLLSTNIEGLNQDITLIGQNNGMQNAIDMAESMADPWGKMKSGIDGISIGIGTQLLPVLLPLIESVNATLQNVLAWADANPLLAQSIGIATLGIFGFIASLALFSIAAGYATVVSTGWGLAMTWIFSPIKSLALAIWGAIPAIWSFTVAILANPITWWMLGITALVAIVVAAILYWREWTAVVIDFGGRFLEMIGAFTLVDNVLIAWEGLKNWWAGFKTWIAGLNPFGSIVAGLNNVIGLANKIPGIAIDPIKFGGGQDLNPVKAAAGTNITPVTTGPAPVSTANTAAPKGGGIIKQMSSVMNANKSTSVGNVTVNNYGQPMSGAKLRDELLFAGG